MRITTEDLDFRIIQEQLARFSAGFRPISARSEKLELLRNFQPTLVRLRSPITGPVGMGRSGLFEGSPSQFSQLPSVVMGGVAMLSPAVAIAPGGSAPRAML